MDFLPFKIELQFQKDLALAFVKKTPFRTRTSELAEKEKPK
jgi:hypothetical protein